MRITRWLAIVAAVLFFSNAAYAEMAHKKNGYQPPKTRAEAIERTKARMADIKEHLAKLEKMTDEQWANERKARQESRKERREQRKEENAAAEKPTAAPATAPAAKQ